MQVTSKQKIQNHQSLVESSFVRFFKNLLHPVLIPVAKSATTFKLVKDNECRTLKDRPVLYVCNHYCGQDIVLGCSAIKERVMVVAGLQNLAPIDEFFFNANGVIFVDRNDSDDGRACKEAMVQHLKNHQNVLIFPEGTSNVSDALLMYPMKWGVIDAAKQAHAQIVPLVLDYNKETMEAHVTYLDPIVVDDLSLLDGITLLRDVMATKRYEYIEGYSMLKRDEINVDELRDKNKELLLSYKYLDYAYEQSVVYRPEKTLK